MCDFRKLEETYFVSPQIDCDQVRAAAAMGFKTIINNRPDGESNDQTEASAIEAAAKEAGLTYYAIPIAPGSFSEAQIDALIRVLKTDSQKMLAYCRSGTRSTLLWALAQSDLGRDPKDLTAIAKEAGYNLTPVSPAMDARSGS